MEDFIERINRCITQREKFDPVTAYEQLKDTYPVVLTMAPSYDYEVPILCGESSAGKFELYDNGMDIVFKIDKPDGTFIHWHPSDIDEAIEGVRAFMDGKCTY